MLLIFLLNLLQCFSKDKMGIQGDPRSFREKIATGRLIVVTFDQCNSPFCKEVWENINLVTPNYYLIDGNEDREAKEYIKRLKMPKKINNVFFFKKTVITDPANNPTLLEYLVLNKK